MQYEYTLGCLVM